MDITPQNPTQQPISDDQDLAKALAGVLPDDPTVTESDLDQALPQLPNMQFEETPATAPAVDFSSSLPPLETAAPALPPIEVPSVAPAPQLPVSGDLEGVKKDALNDLRPLIDKVTLPPEEKFNTYLMLIRSTDDTALIPPAYAAAQAIADESTRAQALLDIIKEIDYLTHNSGQPNA